METVISTLQQFEDADIPYCVLRNFEFASGGSVDGDVDVLVPSAHRQAVERTLRADGYHPFEGDTSQQTRYLRYVSGERTLLTIDLYWDAPTYNGLPFLDGERVLETRTRHDGIYVPADEAYFVELVFHGALNKNRYRDKYREELDRVRPVVDEAAVLDHGRSIFGAVGEEALRHALDGRYDAVLDRKWSLVRSGLRRCPEAIPSLVWNLLLLREVVRPGRRIARRLAPWPTVPVIAIMGPDGVGKSTTVEGVRKVLSANGIDARSSDLGVHSGATGFLRTIRKIYNRVAGVDTQSEERERGTATLGSRSASWTAGMLVIDWLLRFVSAQLRQPDVIVADRYLHELGVYVDPGPFERLFPLVETKPFCGVVLTGDAETIAERSEFDVESVREFQRRLDDVDAVRIETDRDPDAVVDEALQIATVALLSRGELGPF